MTNRPKSKPQSNSSYFSLCFEAADKLGGLACIGYAGFFALQKGDGHTAVLLTAVGAAILKSPSVIKSLKGFMPARKG